jgi:hypothetical protein
LYFKKDIVYDIDVIPALVETIDYIWINNSNKELVLYLASTIRNSETYKIFMENLGNFATNFIIIKY